MSLILFAAVSIFSLFYFQAAPESGDIGPIVALITARALQLTGVVNLFSNLAQKYIASVAGNWVPVVAIVMGIAVDFAILVIGGSAINAKSVVMALVAGTLAGVGSKILADVHEAKIATPTEPS